MYLREKALRADKLARIYSLASQVFSKVGAMDWFNTPALALNNQKPISLLLTRDGVQLVENTPIRISTCVYI